MQEIGPRVSIASIFRLVNFNEDVTLNGLLVPKVSTIVLYLRLMSSTYFPSLAFIIHFTDNFIFILCL